MSDGKKIEKIVRLIQETLKDIPRTKIYSNYRIKNISGSNREIDIFIESSVNDLTIKIAIECKDFKRSVAVEKIEAFNSKCSRIKGISKKIFVSTSGYQADAIKAANDFDIELFYIDDISKDKIFDWFPIKQLKPIIKIKLPVNIHIAGDNNDIENLPKDYNLIVHYKKEKEISIHILGLIWNDFVIEKLQEIRSYLLLNFLKREETDSFDKHFNLPFTMTLKGVHTKGIDGKKVFIEKIQSELEVWFEEIQQNVTSAISYKNETGTIKANSLTFDLGQNEKTDIVFANEKLGMFYTDSKGNVCELETLATYDPKTDKIDLIQDNKNEG